MRTAYLFVGTMLIQKEWTVFVPGFIVAIVGIGYVILEYIPSIEPPENMRDVGGEWGAEQI